MFRISRALSLVLFFCCVYALWVHLVSSASETINSSLNQEPQPIQEQYTQYRQGLRRDLYEGKGEARRHAFFTADKAQMVWQETKKECQEELTNCLGFLDEEKSQIELKSPHAVCSMRPMQLFLYSVECVRREKMASKHQKTQILAEKAVWNFPQESPWRLQTEGMQLQMRPL